MKRLCALALVLLCALTLTGCSREAAVDAYEQVIQLLGGLALTEDSRLQGARTPGEDGFAGSYQADYEDFSGKEVIFGGTTLGRRAGQSIRIRCTLDIREGEARLMMRTGVDPAQPLLESSSTYEGTVELPLASSYLWVEGADWTGSILLNVQ